MRVNEPASGTAVVPDPRVTGPFLQIVQSRVVPCPDRVLHRLSMRGPRHGRLRIAGPARFDLLGFECGVQYGHALLDAVRDVHERDVAAFSLGRVQPQLFTAFKIGVRLGVQ
jgi:hypothetical protein